MCSLCTSISQEEGIDIVCHNYEEHYQSKWPILTSYLGDLMRVILTENWFKFADKHYLQTHGITMATKMAVAFSVMHFHGSRWETTTTCEPLQPFLRLEEIYWWHILSVDSSWDRNQQLYWFSELFLHNNKIYTLTNCHQNKLFSLTTEVFKGSRFIRFKHII